MLEHASLDVVCGYAGSAVPYTTLSLHQLLFLFLLFWIFGLRKIYSEISEFGDLVLSIVDSFVDCGYIIHCPFIGESSLRGSTVVKLVWPNGCLISVNRYTFSPFLLTCMPASALKGCAIFM